MNPSVSLAKAHQETLNRLILDLDDLLEETGGAWDDDLVDPWRKRLRSFANQVGWETAITAYPMQFTGQLSILHTAVARDAADLVEDLLAPVSGSLPDVPMLDDTRPMHLVRSVRVAQLLERVGHDPRQREGEEDAPLDSLVLRNFHDADLDDLVPWFLSRGAHIRVEHWQQAMSAENWEALLAQFPQVASACEQGQLDARLPQASDPKPRLRV